MKLLFGGEFKYLADTIFTKQRKRYFYSQIGLAAADGFCIKKSFEIRSSRVGGIQLGKWRSYQQYLNAQCKWL